MAGAGNGHVSEAGAEQVGVDAGVGVDEHTLSGEALGAVAGDGVTVVEVALFGGVEFDLEIIVEPSSDSTIGMDGFDNGKVTIGDAERLVRCGELYSVANGKLMRDLSVDANSSETAWIISGEFAGRVFNGKQVCL